MSIKPNQKPGYKTHSHVYTNITSTLVIHKNAFFIGLSIIGLIGIFCDTKYTNAQTNTNANDLHSYICV